MIDRLEVYCLVPVLCDFQANLKPRRPLSTSRRNRINNVSSNDHMINDDFSNAKMEMQVRGVIGKLLSGPWMKIFYTSADKQINHLDGIVVIRNVVIELKESCKNPLELLERDNALDKTDTTLKVLQQCCSSDNFSVAISEMFGVCLNAIITVLERQHKRYFEMA